MWDLIVSVPDHCLSFYFGHCDPEHLNDFSYQYPMEAPYEIWLQTWVSVNDLEFGL